MKTVKIKFVGFWKSFVPEDSLVFRLIQKNFNIEITDNPDYIICGCFGEPYEYCKYSQIRIMHCGENYIPDFNLVDYAICSYPINFLDRCFFQPECLSRENAINIEKINRSYDIDFLKNKQYFANFIAGHESEYNIRGDFFKELTKYKRVESVGSYLNNMENGYKVSFLDSSKVDFQSKCKFSLCFESTKSEGFFTEKIVDAFLANTIPIYYGTSTISQIFNPKAFIDISKFNTIQEAIDYIIKVDQDDNLYLSIINEPILLQKDYFSKTLKAEEDFILNIFNQPIEKAYRRSKIYWPKQHEDFLLDFKKSKQIYEALAKLSSL